MGFTPEKSNTFSAPKVSFNISKFSELTIQRSERFPIYVRFEVPVGGEDDWVSRFLEEELVVESRREFSVFPSASN